MADLLRYAAKIFASSAGSNELSEYGSFIASPPGNLYSGSTINPDIVQGLSNYLEGLYASVGGAYSPLIEDQNSLFYLLSYQIAYLLQKGIPDWNAETTYYTNDFVKVGSKLYVSLTDSNLNNLVTDTTYWQYPDVFANSVTTNNGDVNILSDVDEVRHKLILNNPDNSAHISLQAPEIFSTSRIIELPSGAPSGGGYFLRGETEIGIVESIWEKPIVTSLAENSTAAIAVASVGSWVEITTSKTLTAGDWLIGGTAQVDLIKAAGTSLVCSIYVGFNAGSGATNPSDFSVGVNAANLVVYQTAGVNYLNSLTVGLRKVTVGGGGATLLFQGFANSTYVDDFEIGGSLIAIPLTATT